MPPLSTSLLILPMSMLPPEEWWDTWGPLQLKTLSSSISLLKITSRVQEAYGHTHLPNSFTINYVFLSFPVTVALYDNSREKRSRLTQVQGSPPWKGSQGNWAWRTWANGAWVKAWRMSACLLLQCSLSPSCTILVEGAVPPTTEVARPTKPSVSSFQNFYSCYSKFLPWKIVPNECFPLVPDEDPKIKITYERESE